MIELAWRSRNLEQISCCCADVRWIGLSALGFSGGFQPGSAGQAGTSSGLRPRERQSAHHLGDFALAGVACIIKVWS
jgi:hypothetical protein